MHRYYEVKDIIESRGSSSYTEIAGDAGDMQRVKKGERIMYTNEDLACDGRMCDRVTELDKDNNVISDLYHDEVKELIDSRSNGTYNDIADDAGDIISILGDDIRFSYFFSQIANKLARMKHRYSVEDSLLDIAGYAKLELDKFRSEND